MAKLPKDPKRDFDPKVKAEQMQWMYMQIQKLVERMAILEDTKQASTSKGKGETTQETPTVNTEKITQETPKVTTEKESKKESKKSKSTRKKKKKYESNSTSESESSSEEESDSSSSSKDESDATSKRRHSKKKKYKHHKDHLNKVKFQVPAFEGKSDPDAYQDWEDRMERFFKVHRCSEKEKVKLAIMEFTGFAMTWWKKVKSSDNGPKFHKSKHGESSKR